MRKLILISVLTIIVTYAGAVVAYNLYQPETEVEVRPTKTTIKVYDRPQLSKYEVGPPDSGEMLELLNKIRKDNRLPILTHSERLERSTCAKNDHMIANKYWAHTSPDGVEPWYFITDSEYLYNSASENLAIGTMNSTSQSTVDAWMDSPGHRVNILRPQHSQIGMCVTKVMDFLTYGNSHLSTQHFAEPYL